MIAFPPTKEDSHGSNLLIVAFPSDLGWMAGASRDGVLAALVFGHKSSRRALAALGEIPAGARVMDISSPAAAPKELDTRIVQHIEKLCEFAAGRPVEFSDVPLALEHLTPFQARVVAACRAIPWGRTVTYGDLAGQAGSAGAARAVGTVMSSNRLPLVVPCHRVLGSGGSLGGYSASGGLETKLRLLDLESRV